ncbi:hypothetical protein [Aliivibrio fischeri]|uniref:hypothetical protein n=1 Tax=Aliivibrio fischeri TaxID=668 RepID=UPI0012DA91F2|nr:hypothetical protein [Aliivibrio fischeri]MUL17330.1 hypothetical protein [Aliivibrio fischeri]
MNRRELYKLSTKLVDEIENGQMKFILSVCDLLSVIASAVADVDYSAFENTHISVSSREKITTLVVNSIQKEKREVQYRRVIVSSYEIDDLLKSFESKVENDNNLYSLIYESRMQLEDFIVKYESYKNNYSQKAMYGLSFSALSLSNIVNELQRTVMLMSDISEEKVNDDLYHLELYLSNVDDLKSFGIKLEAVDFIYKELCLLLGESTTDHPIIIERIENGSLWLKIAGHTLTATILTSVLNSASTYYLENFTTTGQLQQLPASVKVVNELLKITEQLNEQGVDTTEITDNLNSATKKIANKLDVLLGDQPIIEINDKIHDVGEMYKQKLIEQSKIKLLGNKE